MLALPTLGPAAPHPRTPLLTAIFPSARAFLRLYGRLLDVELYRTDAYRVYG